MITYTNYKKFYTSGEEYTLAGSPYVGLVEVLSGVPYKWDTDLELIPKQLFSTDVHLSTKFTFDRLKGDVLNLPYQFNEIKIGANDYLTYNLVLDRLNKLHTNNSYVYTRMFMPSNDTPISDAATCFFGISTTTDTSLLLLSGYTVTPNFSASDNFKDIGYIKQFASKKNNDDINSTVIFGITNDKFVALSALINKPSLSGYDINIIESSTKFESQENELTFGHLEDICINDTHLFISDSLNNNIIKYDVSSYYNGDIALQNKRNFIELLGNEGDSKDPSRFYKPTFITCNNNHIAVYDSGNYAIKIFDTFFNFKLKLTGPALKKEVLVAMEFDPIELRLYILTSSNRELFLYVFDDCFALQEKHKLEEKLEDNETVLNIAFAHANSNYWYICTNLSVYQKLKNRPSKILSRFQTIRLKTVSINVKPAVQNIWNFTNIGFSQANFTWNAFSVGSKSQETNQYNDYFIGINVLDLASDKDEIVLLSRGKLRIYDEPYVFKQVTKRNTYENFGVNGITFSKDEYVQASIINKELYKVMSDIFTLKNNLVGRFSGRYDEAGVFILGSYNYNINYKKFLIQEKEQYYIHENEKNITGVINRILFNMYKLQTELINLSQVDKGDKLPVEYGSPIIS